MAQVLWMRKRRTCAIPWKRFADWILRVDKNAICAENIRLALVPGTVNTEHRTSIKCFVFFRVLFPVQALQIKESMYEKSESECRWLSTCIGHNQSKTKRMYSLWNWFVWQNVHFKCAVSHRRVRNIIAVLCRIDRSQLSIHMHVNKTLCNINGDTFTHQ